MTRVREGIPEKLTFKLRYNYEEGADDGKDRRNSTLVRAMANTKTLRQGKSWPDSKRVVPDEENDQSRLTQESGDWQSRCEVPREKETQNSVVSVKIV